jgi:lysophospholipid acyltransferase (LPLAT)-like uncharacterized protein
MLKIKILSFLIWLIYKSLISTWRYRLHQPQSLIDRLAKGEPTIFAFWHGDEVAAISFTQFFKLATLTSTSKDGELMTQILKYLRVPVARGSSTRGGLSALKGIVRLAKEGYIASVAVDGPKGPYHEPKPGVFEISRILNAPIYAVGVAVKSKKVLEKTWNKTYIPLPFTKVAMFFDEPMPPVTKEMDPKSKELAEELKRLLNASCDSARILIDGP